MVFTSSIEAFSTVIVSPNTPGDTILPFLFFAEKNNIGYNL